MPDAQPKRSEHPLWDFATRVLIAVGIAGGAYLLWRIRFPMLTGFAAILFAVLLLSLADLLRRFVPVRHGWALFATVSLIVVLLAGLVLLVGSQARSQFGELWQALPAASQSLEQRLGIQLPSEPAGAERAAGQAETDDADAQQSTPGALAVEELLAAGEGVAGANGASTGAGGVQSAVLTRLMSWLGSYGLTIVDALLGLLLVVVAGVYLALDPTHYHRGAVKLFPPAQHALIGETMTEMGQTLRWWLLGKLIAMAIIGALAGLGTWLLGLPAPFAIGIFAGLSEFVPIIGPIVGAVPALLLAATEGVDTVLWTLLLFLGIQQIESNVVAPLVQERMVSIPPALLVLGVGVFGALFGLLGLILAGPLLVVSYVAVKKLWMRQALHESTPLPTDAPRR